MGGRVSHRGGGPQDPSQAPRGSDSRRGAGEGGGPGLQRRRSPPLERLIRLVRGEALPEIVTESMIPRWRVLWTHSNCEQLVCDQLAAKGFDLFLPSVEAWSRRGGVRRLSRVPLFGGYLFLRHAMDKASYLEVYK